MSRVRDRDLNPNARIDTSTRGRGVAAFLVNVFWGWTGVAANIVVGLFLSPYIIRKLGTERFGIWVLVFSSLDYLRLFDLGFRAAIINFAARCRARNDERGVNEVINTGLFYFVLCGIAIVAIAVPIAARLPGWFNVQSDLAAESAALVLIVAAALAVNLVFSAFSGALEAVQRFDVINHAYIVTLAVRSVTSVVLLSNGYGLIALGWLALATQVFERVWNVASVFRVLPTVRLSRHLVSHRLLRQMTRYGLHSFLITMCNMVLNQGPGAIIGVITNPVQVAFFSVAMRLVLYVGEVVPRVGYVTAAKTAEVSETGAGDAVRSMGVYTNRYCLTVFVPLAIFCVLYSFELLRVWITPEFATHSGTVLAILMTAVVITMAGQFNSGAILIGQGKHRLYSYGLVVESVALVAGLFVVTPRYGIVGVAWFVGGLILLSRGLLPAWLLARANGFSLAWYLRTIYLQPMLTAVPVTLLAAAMKSRLPGRNWGEIIAAASMIAAVYFVIALFTCLDRRHRSLLFQTVARPLGVAVGVHPSLGASRLLLMKRRAQ